MQGRHAMGPEIAELVTDDPFAARRLQAILETIAKSKRVHEVCAELGICSQLFERLRDRSMRSAAAALVRKRAGRHRKGHSSDAAEIARLRGRVAELEGALAAAEVRAELAAALPRLAGKKP